MNPQKSERRCKKLGIKTQMDQSSQSQTNGKVERFFRTLDEELHGKYHFDSHKNREMAVKEYLRKFINHGTHFGINELTPRENLDKVTSAEDESEDGKVES